MANGSKPPSPDPSAPPTGPDPNQPQPAVVESPVAMQADLTRAFNAIEELQQEVESLGGEHNPVMAPSEGHTATSAPIQRQDTAEEIFEEDSAE